MDLRRMYELHKLGWINHMDEYEKVKDELDLGKLRLDNGTFYLEDWEHEFRVWSQGVKYGVKISAARIEDHDPQLANHIRALANGEK